VNSFEFLAQEDRQRAAENLLKTLHTGSVKNIEYTFLRKDGTSYAGELNASVILDAEGKPQAFIGVTRDITERKRIEEEARRRAVQLEALRQVSLQLVADLNLETLLRSIASRAVELLGGVGGGLYLYRPQQDVLEWVVAVGSDPLPLGTTLQRGDGLAGKVWEQGRTLYVADYKNWEGRAAVCEGYPYTAVISAPVRWGRRFLGVLDVNAGAPRTFSQADAELLDMFAAQAAIAIQNAQLYQAEREQFLRLQQSEVQLIHAEKIAATARLVASIAHEISNPLQAVQGALELMEEELEASMRREKLRLYLGVVEKEAGRIAALIRRVRDFYRPGREGRQLTDVRVVVGDVLELVGEQVRHSNIVIEREGFADDLPMIQANPEDLKQVFLNLVLNAIDAMSLRGGTLRVGLNRDQMPGPDESTRPAVRIEFTDTGKGMSSEILSRIFEPFFTTKAERAGLGLPVSYSIIKAHGGQITVTSQENVGTTCTVLLPVNSEGVMGRQILWPGQPVS